MNQVERRGSDAEPAATSRPPHRSRTREPLSPARRRIRRGVTRSRPTALRPPTPATVWTLGQAQADLNGAWPLPVVDKVVTSFSEPGDRVVVVAPAAESAVDAVLAAVHRAGRTASLAENALADPATEGGRGEPHGDGRRVADLVIASIDPDTPLDDHFGLACAALLRTGGILAVLTHSDWSRGRLIDPTGPVVTAAQNADLLYLQHIVVVHAPVRDGALVIDTDSPLAEDERRARHRAAVRGLPAPHRRIQTDLLVFAQPRSAAGSGELTDLQNELTGPSARFGGVGWPVRGESAGRLS